jgi:hypothetical protein
MHFIQSRMLAFITAGAIGLAGAGGVLAQEASPAASPAGESLFAGLGLPELTVTASDTGLAVDQAEIPAGRYLVTLNNETGTPDVSTGFVRLDEGETLDDLSFADELAAGTPLPGDEAMPPVEAFVFLYDNYITGGPTSISPQVVIDLPAGDYGIWPDDPFGEFPVNGLTVTGDPEERVSGPEPEAGVTIIEEGEGGVGFSFRVDGAFTAGPQVVKVLNASDQPHFVDASQYPEPITIDQVMATFMFDPSTGATPSPDMIDFEKVTFAGYASTQSSGTTQWVVMDLAAGQVLVACFIPDPVAGGIPHAFEGMIQLFDVAA